MPATSLTIAAAIAAWTLVAPRTPPADRVMPESQANPPAQQQDLHNPPLPRWGTREFGPAYDRLKSAINAEVEALPGHAWAGSWERPSFGWGESLVLAPEAGFARVNIACSNAGSVEHGYVALNEKGQIVLTPVRPGRDPKPEAYWHVRWGSRHYLVNEEYVVDFANAFNGGSLALRENWHSGQLFFLRTDGPDEPRKGLPEVPPEIGRLLLAQPLDARITWVSDESLEYSRHRVLAYRVWLDVGEREGVFEGMNLYLGGAPGGFRSGQIDVTDVGPDWAVGLLRDPDAQGPPRLGTAATSRMPWVVEDERRSISLASMGARSNGLR